MLERLEFLEYHQEFELHRRHIFSDGVFYLLCSTFTVKTKHLLKGVLTCFIVVTVRQRKRMGILSWITSMESSRRELLDYVAKHESTLKNSQNTY